MEHTLPALLTGMECRQFNTGCLVDENQPVLFKLRNGVFIMAEKITKKNPKRLSKSERTHVRRMKQAARNDPFLLNVKK
ncbi:MAG: hypothetical protein EHM20_06015 [Alphaproteobacteria bacterium]|nr:MAG: hypothetical protein EHM20_06015 [Alphaproteobacteria bacterium]